MDERRTSGGWERWAGLAGLAFVGLYVAAFALGIEVGDKDQEILSYYASSSHRTKEIVAFFLIGGAALSLVILVAALRSLIVNREERPWSLSAITWAGGVMVATLVLAGNAVSRAPAFASMDDNFKLDPNQARLLNDLGFMLFASATLAAILLVVAVSLATLRYGVLPRWVGWFGLPIALLLPLGIAFVGFLVFALWVVVLAVVLLARRNPGVASAASAGRAL
jgi:hypothetical protein